jgi:dTDP-4-dehydrorhamnose reductase
VNVTGTKNLCAAAKELGIPIIYTSTVSVFDGEVGDYTEEDEPKPGNFYSQTKFEGEAPVVAYEKGMVIRLNIVGIHGNDSTNKNNFFEWALANIKENKDMNLFADVFINPLSNWTLAEMIVELMEKEHKEKVLHLGSKNILSKADFVKYMINTIGNYSGTAADTSVDDFPGAKRAKQMWLNVKKAEKLLGKEMPGLESEIEKILSHMV